MEPAICERAGKGFLWLASKHDFALYWSHAGKAFEVRPQGRWWHATPAEEWPADEGKAAAVRADFDDASGFGDRRQARAQAPTAT